MYRLFSFINQTVQVKCVALEAYNFYMVIKKPNTKPVKHLF